MNAALFGLGRMGVAAAYFLKKLGYKIGGYDINREISRTLCLNNKIDEIIENKNIDDKYDVVISCMPYYENLDLAKFCSDNGLAYCDLGGHVDTSKAINKLNETSCVPIFTDLGLAPGLISIIASRILYTSTIRPQNVTLSVGCLHDKDISNNPSYYTCNWSLDGLINEYFDDCVVLENHKLKLVKGLSNPEFISDNLVSFNTSGGIGNFIEIAQKYNVANCAYKTIRYKKHYDFISGLDKYLFNPSDIKKIIERCNHTYDKNRDTILMNIKMEDGLWKYNNMISFVSPNPSFTSMQYITAGTLVAVADLIANNVHIRTYEDIINNDNYIRFNANMSRFHMTLENWI